MSLPLYQNNEHENSLSSEQYQVGNTGLLFNKFFHHWHNDWRMPDGAKFKWIETIARRPAGKKELLSEAIERLLALTNSINGAYRCYKTDWRFVTGLGLNNPIENGMTWHHTLGVPYLPGTSVKGLVRGWIEHWVENPPLDDINRIFGTRDHEKNEIIDGIKEGAGSIIFFDALPPEPVRISADVMTPHYSKYYSGTGGEPPGDWMDPTPIPFLTVADNQALLFAVAPRRPDSAGELDCKLVLQWLDRALSEIGAGAKTASGYGRFTCCPKLESKLETLIRKREEEKTENRSSIPQHLAGPIAGEMIKDLYDQDPDRFMEALTNKWLVKMQSEENLLEDRLTIARLLKNWYQVYRKGQWEKPNKKNTPKIGAIRQILGKEK